MGDKCDHCGAPKSMHWPPALARCPQVSGRDGFYRPSEWAVLCREEDEAFRKAFAAHGMTLNINGH